ncbi:MAG: hypothetical protein ACPLSP_01400, partial [Fervidicoccus fontis]
FYFEVLPIINEMFYRYYPPPEPIMNKVIGTVRLVVPLPSVIVILKDDVCVYNTPYGNVISEVELI